MIVEMVGSGCNGCDGLDRLHVPGDGVAPLLVVLGVVAALVLVLRSILSTFGRSASVRRSTLAEDVGDGIDPDDKEYVGYLWIENRPCQSLRIRARSADEAGRKVIATYGGGHRFSIWNAEDAGDEMRHTL